MLDQNLKTQLAAYLEKLRVPIELVASLDDGEKSRELEAKQSEGEPMDADAPAKKAPPKTPPAKQD